MCKLVLIPIYNILFISVLIAQEPSTEWTRTYGGPHAEWAGNLVETDDSTSILVGSTQSYGNGTIGSSDIYLLNIDTKGDTLWTKTYGSSYHEIGGDIIQTTNGDFVIAATVDYFNGDSDIYLIKTDRHGKLLWENRFGSSDYEENIYSLQSSFDGGYIMVGKAVDINSRTSRLLVVKTNASGDSLWVKRYGSDYRPCEGYSIKKTIDNNYVIAGNQWSSDSGEDFYIVKIDLMGNKIWENNFGLGLYDFACDHITTFDGFMTVGYTDPLDSNYNEGLLVKFDSDGNYIDHHTYASNNNSSYSYFSIKQTFNNELVLAGSSSGNLLVHKISQAGILRWEMIIDANIQLRGCKVIQLKKHGYLILGTKNIFSNSSDILLVKLSSDAMNAVNEQTQSRLSRFQLQSFPNPFNSSTIIKYHLEKSDDVMLKIYNIHGHEIETLVNEFQTAGDHEIKWQPNSLPSGLYFYRLQTGDFSENRKFSLQK
ncbi:T9SS C-terminal target domain-containing protein [candidate division KSB1 bacterium]|nr:T9SS type A sorting domain-containing protein [candidate division KSB1 bacterium]RQW06338.1 MAG: T9SS C-terminal target domain-containing protein [candidate division KSB1 bacterium]